MELLQELWCGAGGGYVVLSNKEIGDQIWGDAAKNIIIDERL